MMCQGDSQYFYLDVPIHAITISTKISLSGCDEDVGHPRGKLGQYDDDDDYEKDVEHPRRKMMMIVMNMWASQGGGGSRE